MEKEKKQFNIHFIGIGGVSMSGLAEYFASVGFLVSGSDRNDFLAKSRLEKLGIKAERKAIYRNIDILNKFGIHINKSKNAFYYVPSEADLFHVFAKEKLYL